ncbi:MAG: alcohol dehydrogenase catalytic domain-containing protein [Micromonosporaceae bacterium]
MIRVRYSGVCGSDRAKLRPGWSGPMPDPWYPGHEIVGVDARTGRLVAVDPLVPCRACSRCLRGEIQLCPRLRRIGWDLPGGLGELVLAPVPNVVDLHGLTDPAYGVLADPMAVALHGVRCGLDMPPGQLGVIGSGVLAVCTAACAMAADWNVHLLVRDPHRASELRHVLDVDTVPCTDALPACDAVVDAATGRDDGPLRQALSSVRDGGTVLVQNAYDPGVALSVPVRDLFRRSITVRGSFSYCRAAGRDDFRDAIRLLATSTDWPALLTKARYRLPELPLALDDLGGPASTRPFRVLLAIDA